MKVGSARLRASCRKARRQTSTANYGERASAKFAALAQVHLYQDNSRAAVAAAEQALMHSRAVSIRFMAARTFVETGNIERARQEASSLANELETEPQAYAKIIEGGIALKAGDARKAVTLLQDANQQFDTWIGHFELGRAYLAVGGAETRADSEFDDCLKRRGEVISLFLDEEPTYGYLPVRVLLPGPRPRKDWDHGISGLIQAISRHPRELQRRPSGAGNPQARRQPALNFIS